MDDHWANFLADEDSHFLEALAEIKRRNHVLRYSAVLIAVLALAAFCFAHIQ